jgi:hypothetical protein
MKEQDSVGPTSIVALILSFIIVSSMPACAADTTSPSVPAGLVANPISPFEIDLTWNASTDDVGVTGYTIYREGVQVGTSSVPTFSDSVLAAATPYTYTVAAYDAAANLSAQSASASASTQAASGPAFTGPAGWLDLTDTKLLNVCPSPSPGGSGGCSQVIFAWSSAAVDTRRNRLIIWGGGHNDYYGNEIYSLNVAATRPTLTRLTDPSPVNFTAGGPCPTGTYCEANMDGTPVARHTYNGLEYLPAEDALYSFGGIRSPGGNGTNHTWLNSMWDKSWHPADPVNGLNPLIYTPSPYGSACAYDSGTGSVFCGNVLNSPLIQYEPGTNTYVKLANSFSYPPASTPAIDPVNRLMVFMGYNSAGTDLSIQAVDISGADPAYITHDWTSQSAGCSAMAAAWPGFVFDSALGKFVGWPNTGSTVYIFDPTTKTCTSQTYPGGPPPTISTTGTYGRFAYFPAFDAFVVVNRPDNDAYLLRLSSTPPQDTVPPSPPSNLSIQ